LILLISASWVARITGLSHWIQTMLLLLDWHQTTPEVVWGSPKIPETWRPPLSTV
jgi:hypothetical protein